MLGTVSVLQACTAIPDLVAQQGTLEPVAGDAATMLGLTTDGWPMVIESGANAPNTNEIVVETTATGWRERTPWAIIELQRTDDGSIVKPMQQDLDERVTVFFEPPLPVLTAAMAAARTLHVNATGTIRVHRLGKEAGNPLASGAWAVQINRGKDIDGPAGPIARLSSTFSADLGLSSVEGAVEEVLDLSRGPLHHQQFMRRRVLGIPRDSLHIWTRTDLTRATVPTGD